MTDQLINPCQKEQKSIDLQKNIITYNFRIHIVKYDDFCYYVNQIYYKDKEKFYNEIAQNNNLHIYHSIENQNKEEIDSLVKLRQDILSSRTGLSQITGILLILSRAPLHDNLLIFYKLIKMDVNFTNILDYSNNTLCGDIHMTIHDDIHNLITDYKHIPYSMEGIFSIIDAYHVTDQQLKDIFTSFICTRMKDVNTCKHQISSCTDYTFRFGYDYNLIYQDIIVYLNLSKLCNMYGFTIYHDNSISFDNNIFVYTTLNNLLIKNSEYHITRKNINNIIDHYKKYYIPDLLDKIFSERLKHMFTFETVTFETSKFHDNYIDIDIIKSSFLNKKYNLKYPIINNNESIELHVTKN